MVDQIADAFEGIRWTFADKDPEAVSELEKRIAHAGRQRQLATYSDLVRGVAFDLPNVKKSPFTIDVGDWGDFNRTLIGDFLGYISMRSYKKGGFFSSALVVSKLDGSPGWGYYGLLKDLGLISSSQNLEALEIWADHVRKAHTWYATHR